MQQVFVCGPGDVRLQPATMPALGADDVLLKVAACGICGSDLSYVAMGGLPGPKGEPMPLGHELAGVVAQVGSAVSGLREGQRVVLNPLAAGNNIGNGGREGGFTEYLLVRNVNRERCLYPLPDQLTMEQGALVEPLGVAMHAVNQAEAKPGDKVVIFGAGPIGLGIIACLRYRGIEDVIAVDLSAKRLQVAQQLGVQAVFNAAGGDPWPFVKEHFGSAECFGLPVADADVYIDASGAPPVIQGIFEHAKFGARLVVVALHKQPVNVPFFYVMAKELSIKGAMAYPDEFGDVIDMLCSGKVDVAPMISHRFALDDFTDAFAMASRPQDAAKVMVTMGTTG